jgi:hypothetical protein
MLRTATIILRRCWLNEKYFKKTGPVPVGEGVVDFKSIFANADVANFSILKVLNFFGHITEKNDW